MVVFLLGMPGAGKTAVGKKLAKAMDSKFIDLDREIESHTGETIMEIFTERGEEYFREEESDALTRLDLSEPTVIALGGGTPCFNNNMDWLNANGLTILLETTPSLLARRLSKKASKRPMFKNLDPGELESYLENLTNERSEYYSLSKFKFNGDLHVADLVEQINQTLNA